MISRGGDRSATVDGGKEKLHVRIATFRSGRNHCPGDTQGAVEFARPLRGRD